MPHLRIHTNITIEEAQKNELMKALSTLTAELLSKPESYVMLSLNTACDMFFAATDAPTAYIHLESLGYAQSPSQIAPAFTALLHKKCNIPPERIFIRFDDLPRDHYAWSGKTFD